MWHANGYVQGQDRLFELDVLRHVGRGEAARTLGGSQLASDLAVRRDLYSEPERQARFAAADPAIRAALQAFADGVNRAMGEMASRGDLPAEFAALNHAPEPWTALDSVAVADFLLDRFGTGGGGELRNARLLARLESVLPAAEAEAAFADVVWGLHATSPPTIPDAEGAFAGEVSAPKALADLTPEQAAALAAAKASQPFGAPAELPQDAADGPAPFGLDALRWGSNALLVAPSLAREGRAMVGGGPQTGYFNPPVLYEVGLHGGGLDVVGAGVAGAPGVVVGRTAGFAWTVTSGIGDTMDVVALPAAGPRAYGWDGAARDLACRTERHVVATPPALGAALPRVLLQEVCASHVGPVVAWTLDADGAPTHFFAERKVHRGLELPGAQQWLGVGAARDLAGFRAAFEGFPFTFNFHYAGPEGACYHHVGMQPVRHPDLDPRFPTPAGDAWAWRGALTGAAMPRACDPAQGYFVNWNNLPQRGFPSGDGRDLWGGAHRVQRLDAEVQRALAAAPDGRLGLAEVQRILQEAATRDTLAAHIVPLLVPHAPPAAAAALADWAALDYPWRDEDGDGRYDDPGHAFYDAVRPLLQERVLGDELGPHVRAWNPDPRTSDDPHAADHGRHDHKDAQLGEALAGTSRHPWCDDVRTPAVETCAEVVAQAFADAGDPGPLEVHVTRFTAIGGGPAYEMPMTNRASYVHVHDPVGDAQGTASRSGSAIPPGQSAHLTPLELADITVNGGQGPEHMRDQLPLYNAFQLKPVPVTEAQAAHASPDPPARLGVPRPNQPPVAAGTLSTPDADRLRPVAFRDASRDPDGFIVAWRWEFGDGATSGLRDPAHRYAALGTYEVTLEVRDDDGAVARATVGTVTVRNLPPRAALHAPGEANRVDDAAFADRSQDPDGRIAAWAWDLGDGAASAERDPRHRYAALGAYPVTLTVTDDDGATATASGEVRVVNLAPAAAFDVSPEHPMVLQSAQFADRSTDRDGSIAAWAWDFGDGAASAERDPRHRYLQGGHKLVRLTVTDSDGASRTAARSVFVCAPGADLAALLEAQHVRLQFEACVRLHGGALPV